jgi:hypothetical protein
MPPTSSSAASMHRNSAATTRQPNYSQRKPADEGPALSMGKEEAAVLKLDLSDLALPKVGGLNVDGFKPSFFERLFGKR